LSAAGVALAPQPASLPRRTILVVDDAPLLRELAATFLARAGRVLTAASGEEALAVARAELPDLIVADVRMPGFDGALLCRAVKQSPILESTRIVLLMSGSQSEERERAVRAGADDVLPKPLDRVALLDAARRLLSDAPRGQPRVKLAEPVRLELQRLAWDGIASNLSRGGVFVETPHLLAPAGELGLHMRLPETETVIDSTVQVVWTRPPGPALPAGMGMRFLALDRPTARRISDWLEERVPRVSSSEEKPS
jgi:uncharacterized protein (TIGR02266 family)